MCEHGRASFSAQQTKPLSFLFSISVSAAATHQPCDPCVQVGLTQIELADLIVINSLFFPDLTLTYLYLFYAATKFFWVPSAPPILTRVGPPPSPLWAGRLLNLQHAFLLSSLPSPPPLKPNWYMGAGLTSFASSFVLFQNNHEQQTK